LAPRKPKPYRGLPMEGAIARWYAKSTGRAMERFVDLAGRLAATLPAGARVLEGAPGPGFLAIELARTGFPTTGLDGSHEFVPIPTETARAAGVAAEFVQGDAAHLPFADERFDFIVCCAAFKNFSDPVGAIREMHRVLTPGGRALIVDLNREV